jgi:hypothetical protein
VPADLLSQVTQGAIRSISLQVFTHLHNMDLPFHLSKQTGTVRMGVRPRYHHFFVNGDDHHPWLFPLLTWEVVFAARSFLCRKY